MGEDEPDTDEFTATVSGDFLVPQWGFRYLIAATGRDRQGIQWPELAQEAQEAPCVIIKLQRN